MHIYLKKVTVQQETIDPTARRRHSIIGFFSYLSVPFSVVSAGYRYRTTVRQRRGLRSARKFQRDLRFISTRTDYGPSRILPCSVVIFFIFERSPFKRFFPVSRDAFRRFAPRGDNFCSPPHTHTFRNRYYTYCLCETEETAVT